MITCINCGRQNPGGTRYCTACGRSLELPGTTASGEPEARPPTERRVGPHAESTIRPPTVALEPVRLRLEPGGSAELTLTVRNPSDIVDRYTIRVEGPPAGWALVEPAGLSVYPGAIGTAKIRFSPPRAAHVPAGEIRAAVAVGREQDPGQVAWASVTLDIAPYDDVETELVPRTARTTRRTHHTIRLVNRGNVGWPVAIGASDPDSLLRFELNPVRTVVPPGGSAEIALIVSAVRRRWLGQPQRLPFTVRIVPATGVARTLDGAIELLASLPGWLPRAATIAVALAIAVPAAIVFGGNVLGPKATPVPSQVGSFANGGIGAGVVTSPPTPPPTPTLPPPPTSSPSLPTTTSPPTTTPTAPPTPTPAPTPVPTVADWAMAKGAEESLGNPVGTTTAIGDGGFYQAFDGRGRYGSAAFKRPDGNVVVIRGDVMGKWQCVGAGQFNAVLPCPAQQPDARVLLGSPGPLDVLGYPLQDEQRGRDVFQLFDKGGLYCLNGCGWIITNPVFTKWVALGAENGALGLPIRDLKVAQGGLAIGTFENGFLFVDIHGQWISCSTDGRVISSGGPADCGAFMAIVRSGGG